MTAPRPLPPPEAVKILNTLEAAGFEAFIVGGCVRDALRGVIPKDWDITTSATPQQVKSLFPRTIDTGIAHGTVTVAENRRAFEVTTYRIDGAYSDARRPDTVRFTTRIEEDLSRRDFTVNAIAYSPTHGFADPFGGRKDVTRGIIRAVGDPAHRFAEDALRMLRAVRFAGTLGFEIERATLNAISPQAKSLERVSAERVRDELVKLICGEYPRALILLEETGLLRYVLQGREYSGNLSDTANQLEKLRAYTPSPCVPLTIFFAPFQGGAAPLPALLRALRFDNRSIKAISLNAELMQTPPPAEPYEIKKILRRMSTRTAQESFENLLILYEVTNRAAQPHLTKLRDISRAIFANNECYTLKHLAVNGRDLAAAGIPAGKGMGAILEQLLDAVMREPRLNDKDTLLKGAAPSL